MKAMSCTLVYVGFKFHTSRFQCFFKGRSPIQNTFCKLAILDEERRFNLTHLIQSRLPAVEWNPGSNILQAGGKIIDHTASVAKPNRTHHSRTIRVRLYILKCSDPIRHHFSSVQGPLLFSAFIIASPAAKGSQSVW